VEIIRSMIGVSKEAAGMEIRLLLDDDFMRTLQDKLKLKGTDIAREGITMLNWAVHERERGRVLLSADPDGQNVARLAMPVLDKIQG
jgi:hypothetical protein